MRLQITLRAAVSAIFCLVLFYLVPTALEILLGAIWGPNVYILFGDAVGCAFIAALNWRIGIGLYLVLTFTEKLLLQDGIVDPVLMPWLTDLVPAAALAVMSAAMTASAQTIRSSIRVWDGCSDSYNSGE